jgi:hypothetical protein
VKKVATIANAIPTAPIQLPYRARAGCDRNWSATMKQTIVTRYAR